MSRPTVLYVVHGHPAIVPGGGEQYTAELSQGMRETGRYEPLLLARTAPTNPASPSVHPGTPFYSLDGDPRQYLFLTHANEFDWFTMTSRDRDLATRHFREFLETFRPDVIHFQHTAWLGLDCIRVARNTLPGVPIVYTLHEFLPICLNQGQMVRTRTNELCDQASPRRCTECFPERSPADFFLRKRLIQSHLGLVDVFITPSQLLRQRYIEWGIPAERIRYEENGRRFGTTGARPERQSRNQFAYFGQLTPFKGIDVLLKAVILLGGVAKSEIDIHISVHGSGVDSHGDLFRETVMSLVEQAGASVMMFGRYRHAELSRLMSHTDWVVVPSIWWENSPMVIQEAFAHGCPVICSDIGGMAEKVTHGVDGLHFRAGDSAHLAQTLVQTQREHGIWERLHAGIRRPHAMTAHVETLSALYDELRNSHQRPTHA